MSAKTSIEWTQATWNPTRGCTKQGPECDNCYAMEIAHRFSGPGKPYEGLTRVIGGRGQWNGKIRLVPEALQLPLRWVEGRLIFVDSMSDLFHPGVPFEFIADVFAVMACTTRHTYQVLTKQPARMLEFFRWLDEKQDELGFGECAFRDDRGVPDAIDPSRVCVPWMPARGRRGGYDNCGPTWPLENVWLGVSAGTRASWDDYVPILRNVPAVVRFVSAEPLLEDLGVVHLQGIHWLIAGGESGRRARQSDREWFRSLRDQCQAAGVPFHFKQWGEWRPNFYTDAEGNEIPGTAWPDRMGKRIAGRDLDGRTWDEFPRSVA